MKKLKLESKRVTEQGWAINNFIICIFAFEVSAPANLDIVSANLDIVPAKSLPENYGRHIDKVGQRADIHMTHGRIALVYMCGQM